MAIQIAFPLDPAIITLLAVLSLPHLLYAICWTSPNSFIRFAKSLKTVPLDLFYQAAVALKFVQITALIVFVALKFPAINVLKVVPAPLIALGLALIAAGQILNAGVYKALGKVGVYYGCKFGHKIPWVHGFPFNTVPHPQYAGCILSIWGVVLLGLVQPYVDLGLLTIATVWSGFYVITGIIEQYL